MSVSVDTPDLEITELAGLKRRLVLAGRALPLKDGGISFGIKQRSQTTFYQGNPIATRQVFGPTLNDTTISGRWSDRWIGSVAGDGSGIVRPEAVAELDGFQVGSLAELDGLLESICGSGIELEVKWGHKVRVGTLEEYEPTWKTIHDLEWKMSFQWLSAGQSPEPSKLLIDTPEDDAAAWEKRKDDLNTAADPGGLHVVADFLAGVKQGVADLGAAIDDYVAQVTQFTSTVLAPTEVAIAVASALDGIRGKAQALLSTLTVQVDRATVGVATAFTGSATAAVDALAAAAWLRGLRASVRTVRDEAAEEQRAKGKQVDQRLQDIYIATDGDDLRHVSTVEYGTPDEWRLLMMFNDLKVSRLAAGQVVLVPDRMAIGQ